MTISDLIRKLETIRDYHGNLPVFLADDGIEYNPKIEVLETSRDIDSDDFQPHNVAIKRVVIN